MFVTNKQSKIVFNGMKDLLSTKKLDFIDKCFEGQVSKDS